MYQYILNLDTMKEDVQSLQKLADTFKNQDTPEAKARTKFLFDNMAKIRDAIQASFNLKTDPKHTISAIFRHTDRTGSIASIDLFVQSKRSASRMTSPGGSMMLSVGPKGERTRYISARTLYLRNLEGEDRAFILRMLNSGTDVRTAHAEIHGRGTYNTWGARGAIGARDAFAKNEGMMEQLSSDYAEYINKQATEILN